MARPSHFSLSKNFYVIFESNTISLSTLELCKIQFSSLAGVVPIKRKNYAISQDWRINLLPKIKL